MALHQASNLLSDPKLMDFDALPEKGSSRDGIWGEGVIRKAAVGEFGFQHNISFVSLFNFSSSEDSILSPCSFLYPRSRTEKIGSETRNDSRILALDATILTRLRSGRYLVENFNKRQSGGKIGFGESKADHRGA